MTTIGLCTNYARQCQGQRRDKQGQAGTSRDKQGQNRDKQGQSRDKQGQTGTNRDIPFLFLLVTTCPCLSLSVPVRLWLSLLVLVCPCLSLSVFVGPCLSLCVLVCSCLFLYVSTFAISSCLPLQMNITVFIGMNIVKLTFLAKATIPMHANLVFTFFFIFHLASLINHSFNPNSSILLINIK